MTQCDRGKVVHCVRHAHFSLTYLFFVCLTYLSDACGVDDKILPVRPVRIAVRRQRELMAIIAFNETEDAEWLEEDLVDLSG